MPTRGDGGCGSSRREYRASKGRGTLERRLGSRPRDRVGVTIARVAVGGRKSRARAGVPTGRDDFARDDGRIFAHRRASLLGGRSRHGRHLGHHGCSSAVLRDRATPGGAAADRGRHRDSVPTARADVCLNNLQSSWHFVRRRARELTKGQVLGLDSDAPPRFGPYGDSPRTTSSRALSAPFLLSRIAVSSTSPPPGSRRGATPDFFATSRLRAAPPSVPPLPSPCPLRRAARRGTEPTPCSSPVPDW